MILDTIENLDLYVNLHPSFDKVFAYLKTLKFEELKPGRIEVDDDFYINVDNYELKSVQMTNLEVHNKYIDIQIPIENREFIGYKNRKSCRYLKEIHPKQDVTFYKDKFDFSFPLSVGNFVIFFPQDAHSPLIGNGTVKKMVVKVKIK